MNQETRCIWSLISGVDSVLSLEVLGEHGRTGGSEMMYVAVLILLPPRLFLSFRLSISVILEFKHRFSFLLVRIGLIVVNGNMQGLQMQILMHARKNNIFTS